MEFNIGDRVVCTARVDSLYDTKGEFGMVICGWTSGCYGVEFDKNIGGHDCGCGADGHCLWVRPCWLQLAYINMKPASERKFITLQGNEVA